jgi:hypothetical protein
MIQPGSLYKVYFVYVEAGSRPKTAIRSHHKYFYAHRSWLSSRACAAVEIDSGLDVLEVVARWGGKNKHVLHMRHTGNDAVVVQLYEYNIRPTSIFVGRIS